MRGKYAMIAAPIRGLFTQVITPVEISGRVQMIRSRSLSREHSD